jgi:hypothetical protein
MKKIAVLLFVMNSCVAPNATRQSLLGEWQLTESLIDIGDGKGTWSKTTAETSVSFFDDGKLWSDDPFFSKATVYELKKDSITLSSSDTSFSYFLHKQAEDTLILRPRCIESCGYKYVRLK